MPSPIRWGIASDVDSNIVDGALRAANQLSFFMRRRLKVKSTQSSGPFVERYVTLSHSRVQADSFKLVRAKTTRKEAAVIVQGVEFDHV